MCGGSPKVDTSYQDFQIAEAKRARAEEEARAARVDEGLAHIGAIFEGGTYGDNTYAGMQPILDQRKSALEGYYFPQLDRERDRATDELTFALSRAGLLNSTAAGDKQADLAEAYSMEKGKVLADIASDLAGTRTRMNQSRNAIEAGLRASGDASMAADQALQSAVTFRQDQPELNPIGHIFAGLSQGIGAAKNGYDVGRIKRLATPSPLTGGSGRVVGG